MTNAAQPHRLVLLCVAGLTPQIVTETLYVLTQERGERVDEVRVITTLQGLDRLERQLLDPETGKFVQFCRDYDVDPATIAFDRTTISVLQRSGRRMLDDIRTEEDNVLAADQICEIVRELASDPGVRIHASVAGGRKTMGVYLTAAMQLYGRAQDRLSHVLVAEELERDRDFFYIRPETRRAADGPAAASGPAADGRIHLADIPFIRLRRLLSGWIGDRPRSYGEMVASAQDELSLLERAGDLEIDLKSGRLAIGGKTVRPAPREFFWYVMLAAFRREGRNGDGFERLEGIRERDLDATFRRIAAARGHERPLDEADLVAGFTFLETMRENVRTGGPDLWQMGHQIHAKLNAALAKCGPFERYGIAKRGERGESRYGLEVAPERIVGLD